MQPLELKFLLSTMEMNLSPQLVFLRMDSFAYEILQKSAGRFMIQTCRERIG